MSRHGRAVTCLPAGEPAGPLSLSNGTRRARRLLASTVVALEVRGGERGSEAGAGRSGGRGRRRKGRRKRHGKRSPCMHSSSRHTVYRSASPDASPGASPDACLASRRSWLSNRPDPALPSCPSHCRLRFPLCDASLCDGRASPVPQPLAALARFDQPRPPPPGRFDRFDLSLRPSRHAPSRAVRAYSANPPPPRTCSTR